MDQLIVALELVPTGRWYPLIGQWLNAVMSPLTYSKNVHILSPVDVPRAAIKARANLVIDLISFETAIGIRTVFALGVKNQSKE